MSLNVQFGSGVLFAKPVAGNLAANPTPFRVGVLQEASVDFKGDLKKLFGQKQFPVATARGKIDIEGKAKLCVIDVRMFNQLYFGQTQATGMTKIADEEAGSIPATPFQITVVQAATYVADWGVSFTATGKQAVKVPSSPATGQYSVNESTGVYTFAAADTLLGVKISYSYTVATGNKVVINNQLMGYAPECELFLYNAFRSNFLGLNLNDCTLGQVSFPTKLEDFWMLDISFGANADASDVIGKLYAD